MTSIRNDPEVIVVGAGLAGLRCAELLHAQGIDVLLLERQDQVGGRVRTDQIDGFQLDRGFQVLQTAYPAAQRAFDYEALDLRPFPAARTCLRKGAFSLSSIRSAIPSTCGVRCAVVFSVPGIYLVC